MPARNFICLFDLSAYDRKVAPALRRYAHEYDSAPIVGLLEDIIHLLPELKRRKAPLLLEQQDYEHWIDSVGPDAGHKPSDQTLRELADMVIAQLCLPHGPGLNPLQEIDSFAAWFSGRSEWFADLMAGGEELAGGRLEFTLGSGSLIATRQQVAQFLRELKAAGPAPQPGVMNLHKLLEAANKTASLTVLKTSLQSTEPHPEGAHSG